LKINPDPFLFLNAVHQWCLFQTPLKKLVLKSAVIEAEVSSSQYCLPPTGSKMFTRIIYVVVEMAISLIITSFWIRSWLNPQRQMYGNYYHISILFIF